MLSSIIRENTHPGVWVPWAISTFISSRQRGWRTQPLPHSPDLKTVSMKMPRAKLTKWSGLSYDFYPWILSKAKMFERSKWDDAAKTQGMLQTMAIKHRIECMTSRTELDTSETGDNTRSRFGDSVEAEARFCMHIGVCGPSYFSGWDNIIISHEMELMTVDAGFGNVDLNVVSVLHLFQDIFVTRWCDGIACL